MHSFIVAASNSSPAVGYVEESSNSVSLHTGKSTLTDSLVAAAGIIAMEQVRLRLPKIFELVADLSLDVCTVQFSWPSFTAT